MWTIDLHTEHLIFDKNNDDQNENTSLISQT